MTRNIFAGLIFLLLAGLACGPLTSTQEETPTPTVPAGATPTLAPTATVDPFATQTATPGAITDEPTPSGGGAEGTPAAGEGESTPATGEGESAPGGGEGESTPGGGEGDSTPGGGSGETTTAGPTGCPAGGTNLLTNPGFDGPYKPYGAFTELNHAEFWFPWWKDGESNLRPEFKPAEAATAPNRVRSPSTAQQYFKSFGQFKAGIMQSVLNAPVGSRLQFSAYGQAWSCEEFDRCQDGSSFNPANMLMRVGLDPTGGTDPFSPTIVWSPYFNPLDHWQVACTEAVAERDIVTVFLWASPDGPRQNQDIYWDDAALVVVP